MCLPFTAPWAATCELREQLQLRQSCALLLPVARWRVLSGWCERRADSLSTQSLALPWPFVCTKFTLRRYFSFHPPAPRAGGSARVSKMEKAASSGAPLRRPQTFRLAFPRPSRERRERSRRSSPLVEVRAPVDQNVCQNNGLILGTRYVVYSKTHTHTSVSSDIQAITTLTLQEMLRGSR